ncbi:hypothetical protein GQ600_7193 [Phytophthora cactorum]|nr:hypothetical protein GQ600_7193 [Phytophthora cactorum]
MDISSPNFRLRLHIFRSVATAERSRARRGSPHRGGTHGAQAASPSASVSVDVSGSPFSPALAPTSPRNATIPVQTALSPDVKTEIALAVERLQFATLLGERKKAVSALQSLAQKFDASRSPGGRKSSGVDPTVEEQELGNTAVPAVLAALVSDPRDTELMEALLELLQSIVSRAPSAALLLLEQPPESSVTTPGACKPVSHCYRTVAMDPRPFYCSGRDKNAQQFLAFEEGFARYRWRDEEEDAAALGRRKRVLKLGLQLVRFLLAELYEGAKESSLMRWQSVIVLGKVRNWRGYRARSSTRSAYGAIVRTAKNLHFEYQRSTMTRKVVLLLAGFSFRVASDCYVLRRRSGVLQSVDCFSSQTVALIVVDPLVPRLSQGYSTSQRATSETTQLRGLIALLLGCCLEFLCEDEEEKALKIANTNTSKTQSSRALLAYRATYDISDANEAGEDDEAHYLFMLYERAFTIFYREMAEQIQKRVIAIYTGVDGGSSRASGDSGAPNAMGAYQDLIRMQDKQIHDLQRQVEELKQCTREQFEREKADLEAKTKTMSEAVLEMETRVNGLTMAYEQLEREHQQRGHELAAARSVIDEDQSSLPSSNVNEELTALQAELDAERDTNRRLRSEAAVRKGSVTTQALREKSDAELANARLMKQLEELRVDSERKDEQLAENGVMEDKLRLERRVEELEAAARAAYEKDQQVLQQRIQEVEQARRASPPASDEPENALPSTRKEPQERKSAKQDQQDSFLQELVAGYDVQSRRDKEKYNATIRELEDELARAFLREERGWTQGKSGRERTGERGGSVVPRKGGARERLALQHGEEANQAVNGEVSSAHGSFRSGKLRDPVLSTARDSEGNSGRRRRRSGSRVVRQRGAVVSV